MGPRINADAGSAPPAAYKWAHRCAQIRISQAMEHEEYGAMVARFNTVGLMALGLAFPLSVLLFGAIAEGGEFTFRRTEATLPNMSAADIKAAFNSALTLVYLALHFKFTTGHTWSAEFTTTKKSTLLWALSYWVDTGSDISKMLTERKTSTDSMALIRKIGDS